MKFTTSGKIYLGMVVLAGSAFIADRSWFSPTAVKAQPLAKKNIAAASGKKAAASSVDSDRVDELRDLSGLSHRLQQAAEESKLDGAHAKDAFAPPAAWLARAAEKARQSAPSSLDRFRAQHHLHAIMTGGHTALAIVDGNTVSAGQTVDGFRLVLVREQSAIFESAEGRVELKLPR